MPESKGPWKIMYTYPGKKLKEDGLVKSMLKKTPGMEVVANSQVEERPVAREMGVKRARKKYA